MRKGFVFWVFSIIVLLGFYVTAWAKEVNIIRIGENLELPVGEIAKNVLLIGDDIILASTVRGGAVVIGDDITISSTAVIEGDIFCIGDNVNMACSTLNLPKSKLEIEFSCSPTF